MSRVRVALIGTGNIAGKHAEVVQYEMADAELVAAADVRREAVEAFGERFGVERRYTDVAAMLATERPDVVHICTAPNSHGVLSVQCLEAGAWVLCEKPLAASLAELDAIAQAEARTGGYCASVYQWRFGVGGRHLKRLVDAGVLGRPLLGVCQTTWYRDDAYYAVPWRGTWASELGGCTMGHGIHAMDMFLWLYGPWRDVTARIGTLDHDIEVDDVSLALVGFENGALGSIVNSVVSPRQESYVRLDFQQVTVELKHLYAYRNDQWSYSPFEGSTKQAELERWRSLPDETGTMFGEQVRDFLDCFARGERPSTSGDGARMTLEFIASLYKSALTDQTVRRGSIGPDDPFYHAMNGAPQHAPQHEP